MVQWRPFHPVTQRQVPFLHWPCCLHLGGVIKVFKVFKVFKVVKVIHLIKVVKVVKVVKMVKVVKVVNVVKVFRVLMVQILPHLGSHSLLWQSCPVHP